MSFRTASWSASTCACLTSSAGASWRSARAFLASSCILALLKSAPMAAVDAFCCRKSFCTWTRRLASVASDAFSFSSASCSSWSSCGLLSSRMMLSAFTTVPGRRTMASTRPWVVSRDPADVLGNQRAQPADLPHHRPPLDRVGPDDRPVDGGRGRPEAGQPDADERHRNHGHPGVGCLPDAFVPQVGGTGDIHKVGALAS